MDITLLAVLSNNNILDVKKQQKYLKDLAASCAKIFITLSFDEMM